MASNAWFECTTSTSWVDIDSSTDLGNKQKPGIVTAVYGEPTTDTKSFKLGTGPAPMASSTAHPMLIVVVFTNAGRLVLRNFMREAGTQLLELGASSKSFKQYNKIGEALELTNVQITRSWTLMGCGWN